MNDSVQDSELVVASLNAPEMFGAVFDRHYEEIRAFAWSRLGDAVADDVAAETFARAFADRGRFRPEHESARPWLYGIATNLIRMHARTEKRRLRAYAKSDSGAAADFTESATDRAAAVQLRDPLFEALAGLRRADREIVLLHAWGNLNSEEIGVALGMPDATVRTKLARARRKLAEKVPQAQSVPLVDGQPAESLRGSE